MDDTTHQCIRCGEVIDDYDPYTDPITDLDYCDICASDMFDIDLQGGNQ